MLKDLTISLTVFLTQYDNTATKNRRILEKIIKNVFKNGPTNFLRLYSIKIYWVHS